VNLILSYATPSAYYVLSAPVTVESAAVFASHKARVDLFHEARYPSILDLQDDTRRVVYHLLSNAVFLIAEADEGAKQTMIGLRLQQ